MPASNLIESPEKTLGLRPFVQTSHGLVGFMLLFVF